MALQSQSLNGFGNWGDSHFLEKDKCHTHIQEEQDEGSREF